MMRSPEVTTDQFGCAACDGPATTMPPAKIVSLGELGCEGCGGGMVQRMAATKDSAVSNRERIPKSYRNTALSRAFRAVPMKRILSTAAMLAASAAFADGRFSAADVPGAGIHQPGKVVIRNSGATITAYHFFGNIRQALFSIHTTPARLHTTPFGPAVYDSGAHITAKMPTFLSMLISDAARTHGVDPRLLAAVASRESAFDAHAVSTVGACGLMQLMPETARFLGVADIFDPRENVFGGAHYLRTLLDTFGGDLDLTLAAYNAGPGAVQKYGGVPPYRETQAYVKAVRRAYESALRPSS